jgi:hypothetical protein
MVCDNSDQAAQVLSQLKIIIRAAYSVRSNLPSGLQVSSFWWDPFWWPFFWQNPPIHGAHIVNTILSDAELEKQWWVAAGWRWWIEDCNLPAMSRRYAECKGMADRIINMREVRHFWPVLSSAT